VLMRGAWPKGRGQRSEVFHSAIAVRLRQQDPAFARDPRVLAFPPDPGWLCFAIGLSAGAQCGDILHGQQDPLRVGESQGRGALSIYNYNGSGQSCSERIGPVSSANRYQPLAIHLHNEDCLCSIDNEKRCWRSTRPFSLL
jgi:hypothetical protein